EHAVLHRLCSGFAHQLHLHSFPNAALFRSSGDDCQATRLFCTAAAASASAASSAASLRLFEVQRSTSVLIRRRSVLTSNNARQRSEEHTSELQSRENLVCRLLLQQ